MTAGAKEQAMISTALRVLCVGIAVLASAAASAQEFPSKPIRLIVPFPPGGPNDLIARVVGQKISELLKQQVIVDNRAGAGGTLGVDVVAKAPPDGHTIAITTSGTLAINIALQEKIPYDTFKHLKPVTLVTTVPELLVAATSVPAKDLKEIVALARTKPGTLNYASSGHGSMPHLAGELLKVAAKIDIVHVPYKGAAPAVNDLLGQQVQMAFFDLPVLLPQVEAGKLKAIAVGSRARAPSLKNVPTTAELGYPQVQAENWYGMVAPVATPPAIVARLHQVTVEALRDPGVREKLSSQGLNLVGNTPDEFTAYIRSEIDKWGKVAKAAGLIGK
jgi:tripartite-type tricarboxylate transporter receptor subunit TctC